MLTFYYLLCKDQLEILKASSSELPMAASIASDLACISTQCVQCVPPTTLAQAAKVTSAMSLTLCFILLTVLSHLTSLSLPHVSLS